MYKGLDPDPDDLKVGSESKSSGSAALKTMIHGLIMYFLTLSTVG
jgi:hypothetical protein